jgi:RNA-directed DNA polymerase
MTLGELLIELSKLLSDPDKNNRAIQGLLSTHQDLAEYEVARFFVAKSMSVPSVLRPVAKQPTGLVKQLRSIDPRERLAGVRQILLTCPRSVAAKLLRTVFKDPDQTTRKHARHVAKKMQISDVALKDSRFKLSKYQMKRPFAAGGFNPSGWAFGVYGRKNQFALRKTRLQAHGLPVLSTRSDVGGHLGLKNDDAISALLRPGAQPGSAYVEFEVPKATGGTRRIAAPRKPLRTAQRKILDDILAKVPVHSAAHGFIRERSTVTNAKPHLKAAIVVKMDLVDFFPSVHYRRVIGLFQELGYPTEAAEALAGLCTYRPKLADGHMVWPGLLAQGAPSSPAITNLICRRLDARLFALARKVGATYTRYADDLTFSFKVEPERMGHFLWWVDQICQQEGFTENTKKRRVFRKSCQQRVTGVVVNEHLSVPRKLRRNFRAILNNVKRNGLDAEARGREDFEAYLHGFASYVQMVQPKLGKQLLKDVDAAIAAAGTGAGPGAKS